MLQVHFQKEQLLKRIDACFSRFVNGIQIHKDLFDSLIKMFVSQGGFETILNLASSSDSEISAIGHKCACTLIGMAYFLDENKVRVLNQLVIGDILGPHQYSLTISA